jgi:TolB-like protein/Tfp pilus assembly protein PilF
MTLTAGTRFGPYEILSPLGAGGMGEVYRARDTKLGREVAVKVLPEALAGDAERLARFEREARSLASVNHPNIVTIYSVEEAGGVRLLAMELVEGKTLDLITPSGGLPLARFFEIAVPMADALSAAHERGIVHRDLKPANVMLTEDGRVKVLDFGLARLEATDSDSNVTDMPTESRVELTGEGTVFGTVAYMSPEQARGGKIDARSDVFSLGIVLYEMLTGDRPFTGASSVDLISSILRDQPSPVTEIRSDLPPHVGRILRRCLEKNPRDRYQTSRDVFNELRDLQAETSAAPSKPATAAKAPGRTRDDSGHLQAEQGFRVAVLPFKSSGDAEMASFAVGLGEEIATSLARFRYLSVFASAAAAVDAKLGARYALEGSLRKGGSAIRVSAQLVDVETGARLWAETYNRDLQGSDIFAVQDDVAARIVATVADSYGVLVHSIRAAMRQKDDAELTPVEWQFQYFAYREQITPSAYAELKSRLERAVERDGRQSDLWACLAQIFVDEYAFGFGTDPAALDRALAAARRAVELDRANQFALVSLAQTHFFRQDLAAFGPTAERAMALNPLNTDAVGILGLQIAHTGEFERGTSIVLRAMELNPNHAGWMHFAPLWNHFHKEEYEQALERANRVDVPGLFWPYLVVASACGHLGRHTEAEAAVRDLLALDPEFAAHARSNVGTWHFASGLMDPILEGLRKAGLSIPEDAASSDAPKRTGTVEAKMGREEPARASGPVRADEGFWVAVLPFKFAGATDELKGLAEGLTEDIVTGLSRFSYLRVIARGSTAKYSGESGDMREIGRELGARYVLEGSLRQAGTKLRLAVQLVDAVTGAHLWAETYERTFRPEAVFELQDDLVPRIVSTVADMNGVLPRSMGEAVRSLAPDQMSPYEAVLRSFGYFERVTPEELAAARSGLELAVQKAPANADAQAMLALLCVQDHGQGFNLNPDSLATGLAAARRAVEAAPSSALAHFSLAQALFFQREFQSFRNAAERAVALNPMDGNSIAFLGELLTYAGDGERGLELAARAKQLNPNHPGWYWYADLYDAYRRGDYRGALGLVLRANLPGHWGYQVFVAATSGQLGEHEAGAKALKQLLKLRPDFAATARDDFERWWEPDYVERLMEGLRKAGLPVSSSTPSDASAKTDAAELAAAAAPKPGAAGGVAIAVLPFSDMSAAKDQEYLCEGMAEEIMNALVRVTGIRVASRTSAFRARREGKDLSEIARTLSVGHVLEGSVRSSGTRLRVTAQLTDVSTGFQLWSERFDREATDIFAVQDEIARGVVDAVKARLSPGEHAVPSRPQAANLEAYRCYLKGRHLRAKEHLDGALRAFEEAVRFDPSYAPAWTGLAEATALASVFGMIPAGEACATARKAIATAKRLEGESAEGLHVEAFVAWIERRWAAMETAWRRAIELQPGNVLALASFGISLCSRQRLDEALPFLESARHADPLSSYPYALTGGGLLNCGRPLEALRYLEDALSFEKDDATALDNAGMARVALGRVEEGIATLEHAVAVSHRGAHFLGTLGWALATAGRKAEARTILEELRARPPAAAVVSEAWLLGALGETDAAFEVIERAEEQYVAYLYFTGLPGFDPLRTDPRFGALLKRLGLPSSFAS